MKQTSIHLCPCKESSEKHNKREKQLDYVQPNLSSHNEWWSGVESLGQLRSQIAALVKEKTGRKMQAKAEPLREGVVVIQEDTTMQQLQELGLKFKERYGITLVQIAIHRDEGHWVDSEGKSTGTKPNEQPKPGEVWKPNLHAHLVFDWYNHETGKSIKTTKLDTAEMQTITAEVLGMERGKSSNKKHLTALEYKVKKKHEEVEKEHKRLQILEKLGSGMDKHFARGQAAACNEIMQIAGIKGKDGVAITPSVIGNYLKESLKFEAMFDCLKSEVLRRFPYFFEEYKTTEEQENSKRGRGL